MKKKLFAIVLAIVVCVASVSVAFAMSADEAKQAAASVVNTTTDQSKVTSPFIDVVKNVQGSVVGVNNYQNYTVNNYSPYYGFGGFGFGFGGGSGRGSNRSGSETTEKLTSTGSGVVVYDHVVLTNYHVVEDATRLTLSILNSDDEIAATVVAYDESLDVAVVYAPDLNLTPVALGDSDQLQVGEWSICIGNPLSDKLRGTVTVGIISALDRQINSTTTTDKYGLKRQVTNSMIQTDAAINSGNSGGGMFNVLGQLMGIPSLKYTSSYMSQASIDNIGMCIPINVAKPLIREALEKYDGESVSKYLEDKAKEADINTTGDDVDSKPRLGVSVQTLDSTNNAVARQILPKGCLVTKVEDNSAAAAAGIQAGDIIVDVDGTVITSSEGLQEIIFSHAEGDTVQVKVYRAENVLDAKYISDIGDGEYIDMSVTLKVVASPAA